MEIAIQIIGVMFLGFLAILLMIGLVIAAIWGIIALVNGTMRKGFVGFFEAIKQLFTNKGSK